MSDKATAEERYLRAAGTSHLGLDLERPCDADQLLAAAYAVSGSERKKLALRVWRLRATGDMAGARQLASELGARLRTADIVRRVGYLRGGRQDALNLGLATEIAMTVLKWWQKPACLECDGRGHPLIHDAPVLDEGRDCPACHGTGQIPLERLVRHEHVEHARWLEGEMNGLSSIIFDDMARLLRRQMDF